MERITINIVNVIGDVFGVEAEDGQKVFDLIEKGFKDEKKVKLSFKNVAMLTTAFLHTAVGQLYNGHSEDFVRNNFSVSDISESGEIALKRLVDTAKLWRKYPSVLDRRIDEIIEP